MNNPETAKRKKEKKPETVKRKENPETVKRNKKPKDSKTR